MSVLRTSWQCSLAATALWAMLGPSPAAAQPAPGDRDRPPSTQRGPSDQGTAGPQAQELAKKRDRIMEEMKSLRDKMKDASEADRKELQEKMKNLYEQIKALPQPPGSRPANPSRPEGRGDVQGRISHLRVAAENLRAAGMGDMADQILKRIEHLQAESREGARPPATPPRGETTRSGPGGPPSREATGPGRGEGPVSELRNEVQQMRREMQELREQVRRLVEKQSSPR